jgi:hypothetical protein
MLNRKTCGTSWLLLDDGAPEETVSLAMFVFLGKGAPHDLARIHIVPRSSLEILARDGGPETGRWLAELERAVTLDDLIAPPDWIRKAAS